MPVALDGFCGDSGEQWVGRFGLDSRGGIGLANDLEPGFPSAEQVCQARSGAVAPGPPLLVEVRELGEADDASAARDEVTELLGVFTRHVHDKGQKDHLVVRCL